MVRTRIWQISSWGLLALLAATILVSSLPGADASATPVPTTAAIATSTPSPMPRTAAPTTTLAPNVNEPFPVTWDQLLLPGLGPPWALVRSEALGREIVPVMRSGSRVGLVRMYVSQAGTYTSVDLVRGGFAAVWQLAAGAIKSFVSDRAAAGAGIRAEPEAIREVRVAGGRGVRTAFRDVEIATGKVIGRVVFIHHWDGRALWMFMTSWPPDDITGGFDTLDHQTAFDAQLEALVAGLRLPAVLPPPRLD